MAANRTARRPPKPDPLAALLAPVESARVRRWLTGLLGPTADTRRGGWRRTRRGDNRQEK